ncbi:hypothetical protein AXK11_01345 [Cephaloticoccus primus]|uniref:SlyX protein n=1 Tax=Cephaloticoccus primus TaxID=1548207 RepID=A0A139SU38_9BACT|nr:hypothetical protein [Cephaloticoccus primus]KXU38109.1 hypothetical protein AXK11_01345 [Cephaloticoccus primus]
MKPEEQTEALRSLAERLTALERHVFEQDKEMLALSRELERLRGGLVGLRDSVLGDTGEGVAGGTTSPAASAPERPPHY